MIKKYNCINAIAFKLPLFLCILFSFNPIVSQEQKNVEISYLQYVNLPREVAFAHLNKSLYVKGETIGFSVYVFDKNTKKPSHKTTNVYTVITDGNNKTIKEQLLWAKDGKANGIVYLDSTFTQGNYTFKAYTNWMKNFNEQNLFSQSIKVVDPYNIVSEAPITITSKLDAQFLPEGGHLVANTENTIGVVIKDTLGYGIPNITGNILDQNDMVVSNFKTNAMGIGKFLLLHDNKKSYRAEVNFRNRIQTFNLNFQKHKGINITLNQVASKVALTFNTNTQTLPVIKGKPFTLFLHNGFKSKSIPILFGNETQITKAIDVKDLFPGINIFTLFDQNNKPILERLHFNYVGVDILKTQDVSYQKIPDSLKLNIPLKLKDSSEIAKLSISVLPSDTKSYNAHHNILSYTMLQPYVKGFIENAKYYFTDISKKTMYELDNLLMTQGWSSYDWTDIFNNPPKQQFEFETGISFTANTGKKDAGKYILLASENHDAQAYVINENESLFSHKGFFVEDDNVLEFTEVVGRTKMKKPNLYLQFSPSKIPSIDNFITALSLKENSIFEANTSDIAFDSEWNKVEVLDEVVIKADLEKKRVDKLTRYFSSGRIDVFDDEQRANEIDLATYLSGKGFQVFQDLMSGSISIKRGRETPAVFINKRRVRDFRELFLFSMRNVDYIAIDRTTKGYDASIIGLGGSIHIKTDPKFLLKNNKHKLLNQTINLPLTFTSPKTFYTPKYFYYQSDFFREYGVIDWIPNITLDNINNTVNLKILDTKTKQLKLFIEGTTNQGRFISEEKTIHLD